MTAATFARELAGRHAIVTGGGRGIGAAIAAALATRGAALTLLGRDGARVASHAAALRDRHGVDAAGLACDVTDADAIVEAVSRASSRAGDAYMLVNNAGVAESAAIGETTRELWDRTLAVDLTAAFLCAQAVLPAMLDAGAGRIVNIASTAGLTGYARLAAYCAAKHGLVGLTRSLAQEVASRGVTVNAVCPGYTETEMAQRAISAVAAQRGVEADEARRMITRRNPMGRLVRPDEVASLVAWLCGADAAAVTGQALVVAGGELG